MPRRMLLLVAKGELLAMTLRGPRRLAGVFDARHRVQPAHAGRIGPDAADVLRLPADDGDVAGGAGDCRLDRAVVGVSGAGAGASAWRPGDVAARTRCRYCIFRNSPHPGIAWP